MIHQFCYDWYESDWGFTTFDRSRVFIKEQADSAGDLTVEGNLNLLGDLLQDGDAFDMGDVSENFRFLTRVGVPESRLWNVKKMKELFMEDVQ